MTSRQGYVDTSPHSEGLGDRGGGFRLEGSPPRRVSPSDRAAVKVRPAVGVEVVLQRSGEPALWIDGERFGVGESLEPAGQVGGGGGWVEGTVFEGDGDGVGHVQSVGMGLMKGRGQLLPAGVGDQAGIDPGGEGLSAAGIRSCGEPVPDLGGEAELLVGKAGGVVVPGVDERPDGGADDVGVDADPFGDGVDGGLPRIDGLGRDHHGGGEGGLGGGQVGQAFFDEDVGEGSGVVEGVEQLLGVSGLRWRWPPRCMIKGRAAGLTHPQEDDGNNPALSPMRMVDRVPRSPRVSAARHVPDRQIRRAEHRRATR